ncbi:MAG: hypothetical protein VX899_20840 [Myxococcota bacterium]|nr:hypothetical protein [Myxococcota bacterium]
MSDEKRTLPGEEEEVDYLFQARMGLFKWFSSNWKIFAGIAAVILVGSFFVSVWTTFQTNQAKKGAAAVHAIDAKMPKVEQMALMGILPMDDLSDPQRVANLEEGARRYEQAGDDNLGAASATAYLKAAQTWERLGKAAEAEAAYQKALDADDTGVLGFSARTALAQYALDAGDSAKALEHYSVIAGREAGFLAEQALLYTASVQADAGDTAALQATYEDFMGRFPSSPRAQQFQRYPDLKPVAVAADAPADPVEG